MAVSRVRVCTIEREKWVDREGEKEIKRERKRYRRRSPWGRAIDTTRSCREEEELEAPWESQGRRGVGWDAAGEVHGQAQARGRRRRTSGGCGSGTPLPWIGIVTRGDEDGMDTPLEKVHAGRVDRQEQTRRRDGMRRLLPSSSVELQKNRESGDEHSLWDFFALEELELSETFEHSWLV
jgi:hypothetical protein